MLAWPRRSAAGRATTPFPTDLMNQGARRLQALALLYAFTFFMSALFPSLLFRSEREILFEGPIHWAPAVISILVSLSVVAVLRTAHLPARTVMAVSLIFEIVSSYGIATAEFMQPVGPDRRSAMGRAVLGRRVDAAVHRRRADPAALRGGRRPGIGQLGAGDGALSLSRPPRVVKPTGLMIFFGLVFPYLLVVVMAYVGARVVYALGTEVSRARELGSYRLVEQLGEGGMGEVWRARHRLLARPAAIKLIRPSLAGDGRPASRTRRCGASSARRR